MVTVRIISNRVRDGVNSSRRISPTITKCGEHLGKRDLINVRILLFPHEHFAKGELTNNWVVQLQLRENLKLKSGKISLEEWAN